MQTAAFLFALALPLHALSDVIPLPAQSSVIPLPAEVVPGPGSFEVDSTTVVHFPPGDRDAGGAARRLVELWSRTNGLTLEVADSAGTANAAPGNPNAGRAGTVRPIVFRRRGGFPPEGYGIEVTPRRITVSATTAAGLYYGAVTLWQLLPPGRGGLIPAQTIRDAPAYRWRGLMLDSARHFQSPEFIRSMIDWMSWHKLNVLHWHLTDDQGWRIEISKYPRLTSVGAWRTDPGGARYGGFYTRDQVQGIVRFAAARHVQIIPEIDMPGHATAAIAAYPNLGAAAAVLDVSPSWGIHTHLFNLEPQTFAFLDDVLTEVMQMFPSGYVHIGGDEAVKDEWNASPAVQARARRLGLTDPGSLQAYFTQRIARFVAAHGRRIVGWDEILRPDLEKGAVVMSWHGVSGAHAAALSGHDAVLTPWPTLYFDNRQSTLATEPPGRLKVISLEDVYRFEPRDLGLDAGRQRHVLGVQANIWTEHIRTEARIEWMALPRAAALAEVAWSSAERRRWPDFLERLAPMFARYKAFSLNYADSVFAPAGEISAAPGGYEVRLSNQAVTDPAAPGDIRFTLDGREPSADSSRYAAPLGVPAGSEVRAAAFVGSEQASRTWSVRLEPRAVRRRDSHSLQSCTDLIGLLLEAKGAQNPLAVDIMNPCWIYRGIDLSEGPRIVAAVAPLPFNYEIGEDAAKIRVGDSRTAAGELEVHEGTCDTPVIAALPLAPAVGSGAVTILPSQELPHLPGRHDLCLRFARPRLDPMWALDSVEFEE